VNFYLAEDALLIRSLLPEGISPPEFSESLFLNYAVLMRAKGSDVTASDVHDAWAAWAYVMQGPHAALVPFADLDRTTRQKDFPYVEAIHRASEIRAATREFLQASSLMRQPCSSAPPTSRQGMRPFFASGS
jgi:hypothetical protein